MAAATRKPAAAKKKTAAKKPARRATPAAPKPEKVSALKAAIDIARAHGGPIKVKDLIEQTLATPGVSLAGKTPKATVAAAIYTQCAKPNGQLEKIDSERGIVQYRAQA